jgi:hypothetical protein
MWNYIICEAWHGMPPNWSQYTLPAFLLSATFETFLRLLWLFPHQNRKPFRLGQRASTTRRALFPMPATKKDPQMVNFKHVLLKMPTQPALCAKNLAPAALMSRTYRRPTRHQQRHQVQGLKRAKIGRSKTAHQGCKEAHLQRGPPALLWFRSQGVFSNENLGEHKKLFSLTVKPLAETWTLAKHIAAWLQPAFARRLQGPSTTHFHGAYIWYPNGNMLNLFEST